MTDHSDLCARLRGEYRIPIADGLGPAGGAEPDNEREFVRHFPSPPIQNEAADAIQAIVRERDEARAENERLREALVGIEEYWNGSETEGAMSDALHEIVYRARAALNPEKTDG